MSCRAVFMGRAPNGLKISQSCPTCLTHQRLQQERRKLSYSQVETITVRDGAGTAEQNVEKRWFEGFYHSRAIKKMHKKQMYFLFRSHLLLPLVICTSSWKKKSIQCFCQSSTNLIDLCAEAGRRCKDGVKKKVDLWNEKWTEWKHQGLEGQ